MNMKKMRLMTAVLAISLVSAAAPANAAPFSDSFDADSSANYEVRNYGTGADLITNLSIDAGDNNILELTAASTQVLHKTKRLYVGETFQLDILTAPGLGFAVGPVLQQAPPTDGGYNLRLRWNAGAWAPSFSNGYTGTFTDDDTSTPAAGDTHWVERVSETLFSYYRGADMATRVKVSDITFDTEPGNIYVGFQAWNATIQADNFAIVSPDGPAPPPGSDTISFQEGVDGYSGTADTNIGSGAPSDADTNYGAATKILVTSSNNDGLLRFDGIFGKGAGKIPLKSTISSATLSLQTGTTLYDGTDAESWEAIYQLLQAFDETTDTWNNSFGGDGVNTDDTEAGSAYADRRTGLVIADDELVPFDVTTILQNWSNGQSNFGFLIKQVVDENKWSTDSSETGTASRRPLLSVEYTPPPTGVMFSIR